MSAPVQTVRFDWQGIPVSIEYQPDWSPAMSSVYGHSMAHLAIRSEDGQPLPITETGYRSAFVPTRDVEAEGGPEALVRDWLDTMAAEPEWREQLAKAAQLTLF